MTSTSRKCGSRVPTRRSPRPMASAARGVNKFHVKAVYLSAPGDPGDISLPFSAAGDEAWASAVMTQIGGGSFLDANFGDFADELFDLIKCPPPDPAHIAITKVADEPTVDAGEPIGFTITVSNTGDVTATGVALSDDLPAGGDLDWSIENQTGISGCTIEGAVRLAVDRLPDGQPGRWGQLLDPHRQRHVGRVGRHGPEHGLGHLGECRVR